ncbi:MAG TPA: DUF4395 domain-containing protein [Euzebyales bacterium]
MRTLFRFPDPVNEASARLVAAGVVLMCALVLAGRTWVLAALAYGFVARVATGPTLSPLGQLVTRWITPNLSVAERLVPGSPKRFAQGIGAALSVSAAVLHFGFAATTPALVLVGAIAAAATLEAAFGFCLGCWLFARLIALGVLPERTCAACDDLRLRHPSSAWTS